MDYLERIRTISGYAQLSEEESSLLRKLTDPLNINSSYDFCQLYGLFKKIIISNKGDEICRLVKEKREHFETEPSAYADLEDDVQIG